MLFANIFQPLITVFQHILLFFHDNLGFGWGASIIALTIAARAVLVPLTLKQLKSMQRLQALSPKIKEIQAKYKGDKQRTNQEMMRFYQQNKVNPLASCLPLALQLPVFISLYYMLRNNLRHNICPQIQTVFQHAHPGSTTPCGSGAGAHFLFIPDLTNKASGAVLVVLIVLYIGTQLASSLLMSVTADKTQRRLLVVLPLIFVTFIVRFPAGLVLYWITTNLWTIAQQFIVRKTVGQLKPVTAVAGAGAGATAGRALTPAKDKDTPVQSNGGKPDGSRPEGKKGGGAKTTAGKKAGEAKNGARRPERVAAGPPPSARKKKKRSGRRR